MDFPAQPIISGVANFTCFLAGYLLARALYYTSDKASAAPLRPDISDAEIEAELLGKRKIEAIRLYRQRSGCDVKEAKRAIEQMARRLAM